MFWATASRTSFPRFRRKSSQRRPTKPSPEGNCSMSYATSRDGVRLYIEEAGEGLPIVFVHEFGDDHRAWEPQMRFFSRRYRCITFASRGYPPSDVPDGVEAYS